MTHNFVNPHDFDQIDEIRNDASKMLLYVYFIGPTDDWHGWRDFKQFVESEDDSRVALLLGTLYRVAQEAANKFGWQIDIQSDNDSYITAIPSTGEGSPTQWIIAWEQYSGSKTVIASQQPLGWLRDTIYDPGCENFLVASIDRPPISNEYEALDDEEQQAVF